MVAESRPPGGVVRSIDDTHRGNFVLQRAAITPQHVIGHINNAVAVVVAGTPAGAFEVNEKSSKNADCGSTIVLYMLAAPASICTNAVPAGAVAIIENCRHKRRFAATCNHWRQDPDKDLEFANR